ncbi:MAG: PleD family two-component system response regulator [Alphaproteobacteria bacterium]|nr:PleD family two-component system response regulator [Alphaproteobacteria bacterium]
MTARVLVVDDIAANVKLLEAKLSREYFEVLTATNGPAALALMASREPDIVLLDVMMPGMDGFEVCRRIKDDPTLMHIPVVMVTALSDASDRVSGLQAGADDFLTKPVDDVALFARVRSLVRLKMMMDELRLRERTGSRFGVAEPTSSDLETQGASILVVEDREAYASNVLAALQGKYRVELARDDEAALHAVRTTAFDLVIVSLTLNSTDGLRLCSQLRSLDETRNVPLLMITDESPSQTQRLVKGLELGVNDYIMRPIDRSELQARTTSQVRRKRYEDRLRSNYQRSLTMALTDGLTGLYNRRYLLPHLAALLESNNSSSRQMSLLLLDIDHFKQVNDRHGHAAGDEVLIEFAQRLSRGLRGIDLAARLGGEEFAVALIDTRVDEAVAVADRLRAAIADEPFILPDGQTQLRVTVSLGVAEARSDDSPAHLLRRADIALYRAKRQDRNRVEAAAEADESMPSTGQPVAALGPSPRN